jgi:DnaJ family protein A protein 2
MPLKRSDAKGDLFLVVKIEFPKSGWTQDDASFESLKKILPGPDPPIEATEVDEVEYNSDADIEEVSP